MRRTGLRFHGIMAVLSGALFVLPFGPSFPNGQQQAVPSGGVSFQHDPDLERRLEQFITTTEQYTVAIRNLTAEETKVIEVYRASGDVEKRREIISDLVVYSASRDGKSATTEYRDVRIVDGKAVEHRGERALKLLVNASRADSLEDELTSIDRETSRYEFRRHLRGFAARPFTLPPTWRQTHKFGPAEREQIAGHDVVAVSYRAPDTGSSLPVPKEVGPPTFVQLGRLWLDAETNQLRRCVWEIAVVHPAVPDPLVMVRADSAYGPSRFGVLLPERIVFQWFSRFSHPKNGRPSFELSERTTFTYGSFKRFDVATTESLSKFDD